MIHLTKSGLRLSCCADGCERAIDEHTYSDTRIRRIARERGWSYIAGRDLCPAHAAARSGGAA